MLRKSFCFIALVTLAAAPISAQEDSTDHDDPYAAAPQFVSYDGSFQYSARIGITVDSVRANNMDEHTRYFALSDLPIRAGPSEDSRVVKTYTTGDSIRVGRMYPDGWSKVWTLHINAESRRIGTIIGWVNRNDPRLGERPPRPRYTRRRNGRTGVWHWLQYPDPITDEPQARSFVFAYGSRPPLQFDTDAYLLFTCGEEGRKIVIRDPFVLFSLGGQHRLRAVVRVDDNDPIRGSTGFNTTGDGAILPDGWEHSLTRQIRAGRMLYARIFDSQGTGHDYSFDLTGSTAAIRRAFCFSDTGV